MDYSTMTTNVCEELKRVSLMVQVTRFTQTQERVLKISSKHKKNIIIQISQSSSVKSDHFNYVHLISKC